ncbi:hypothetical protein CDV50_14280 [Haematobacter massiliensis]|uniref:Uncharacterized protein n=2 Tax=Haematobacter massiliensis TaxID=195105 RepID=A0A086Y745_9RHOB|nr:hypothetical protein [Haematobacter massiliensis]KFI30095.1 hypothetical protein CN97_15210 [Haematobacter massiliensis]OWJ70170.1 hypothetical protein CDV50_14280 [Haematobacter massiliensis]OWJ88227.1 hypothetical protein CDV51_02090 [Haematobacter massiliensis]
MCDVAFDLNAHVLTDLGEVTARAGIASEGDGIFSHGNGVAAHSRAETMEAAAGAADMAATAVPSALASGLKKRRPGQPGAAGRRRCDHRPIFRSPHPVDPAGGGHGGGSCRDSCTAGVM